MSKTSTKAPCATRGNGALKRAPIPTKLTLDLNAGSATGRLAAAQRCRSAEETRSIDLDPRIGAGSAGRAPFFL